MPYLGNDLQVAQPSYRNIDDISGSFNSSTTSFPLLVSGAAPVPFPINSNQCLISVAGVVQRPDDSGTEGFRISGGNIIFSSAPSTGADFFGVILAGADYVNVGANFPSGSAAVPSITFDSDLDTGIYNSAANQVSITTAGTERLRIDSAGQIEAVSLGTAAAPSFSFTTDPNTGIYSPGADQVAISTNGTGRLFVDASGNVGVGYASPSNFAGGDLGATAPLVVGDGTGSRNVNIFSANNNYGHLAFSDGTSGSSTYAGLIQYYHVNDSMAFYTGSSQRMLIDSSGRLGLGTSSPSALLDVKVASDAKLLVQDGNTTGNVKFNAVNNAVSANVNLEISASNTQFFNGGSERARIDSSGRLLVGTSSYAGNGKLIAAGNTGGDAGTLDICWAGSRPTAADTDIGYIRWYSADNSSGNAHYASIYASSDGASSSGSDIPGRLVFSTTADGASSPTERARINQRGAFKATNTGSYTNSTAAYHEFVNNADDTVSLYIKSTAASGQQYGLYIETANDQNDGTRFFLQCIGAATERATIRSNGGIANYSANNVNLSDRNVKKDIAPAAGTWDCLKEWEIVNFRYKDQSDEADLSMGVIAQQVAESCPEVITVFQGAKEATEDQPAQEERIGVKEQQMMWMAIKALQEAQLRIETLEAEVEALKAS